MIMSFTFIHAADLHIDSPLAGLSLKDKTVAARFAHAGRRALEALVEETIATQAAASRDGVKSLDNAHSPSIGETPRDVREYGMCARRGSPPSRHLGARRGRGKVAR